MNNIFSNLKINVPNIEEFLIVRQIWTKFSKMLGRKYIQCYFFLISDFFSFLEKRFEKLLFLISHSKGQVSTIQIWNMNYFMLSEWAEGKAGRPERFHARRCARIFSKLFTPIWWRNKWDREEKYRVKAKNTVEFFKNRFEFTFTYLLWIAIFNNNLQ